MEKIFFGPKNFHKVLSTMVQVFFGPKNSQSCPSHRCVLFFASFSLIWVKTPLPLVLSGWYKYQNEAFASQNVFLEHLEWLSENCGYWFLGPRSFTTLILSLFWALLWRFQPNLCENQLPLFRSGWFKHKKGSFQQSECVFRTFEVIGWKLRLLIFSPTIIRIKRTLSILVLTSKDGFLGFSHLTFGCVCYR